MKKKSNIVVKIGCGTLVLQHTFDRLFVERKPENGSQVTFIYEI